MDPTTTMHRALNIVAERNALSDAQKALYENFRAELEGLVKRLEGIQWQDDVDRVTIDGSTASGTALDEGDADLTIWTHFEFTRALRKKLVDMMRQNMGSHFKMIDDKIGPKAVQADIEADDKLQSNALSLRNTEAAEQDMNSTGGYQHLLFDVACFVPEQSLAGELPLSNLACKSFSCDIVFANATFGNIVARQAEPGMYPLPPTVCTVVRLFKIAKAAGAPGLCKVKGYQWDALVTRRYELYMNNMGREPSVLELTFQVLAAFPDKAKHKFNAADLIMTLQDQVFEAMYDSNAKHRVPKVYFSSILSNGEFSSAGNTATRLRAFLTKLLADAHTGCQEEVLADRLEQFLKTAWNQGGNGCHTPKATMFPNDLFSPVTCVSDNFSTDNQAALPHLEYSLHDPIKDLLPDLDTEALALLLASPATQAYDSSDESPDTEYGLVSDSPCSFTALTDEMMQLKIQHGDRTVTIKGPESEVKKYLMQYNENNSILTPAEAENFKKLVLQRQGPHVELPENVRLAVIKRAYHQKLNSLSDTDTAYTPLTWSPAR